MPEKSEALDEGIIAFMGAAKWPDEIKFGHSKWNHKEWHYVDFPVTPPDFAVKPESYPDNDIIFAINLCVQKLKDQATTGEDKACWLSWLIHLVGDITQPLHCCALINEDFTAPLGDRGGNLIFVKATEWNKGVPLHKMFDDALGTLTYGKTSDSAPLLPEGYTKKLKSIATERVTVAGY